MTQNKKSRLKRSGFFLTQLLRYYFLNFEVPDCNHAWYSSTLGV